MADYRDIWSPAKVFSPSVARQQTQFAKDWTYVDQWLLTRHPPSPSPSTSCIPPFERNPDTLKALLALAAANEAADEARALEKKVKQKALSQLQHRDAISSSEPSILGALEENLTPAGTRALNSLALLSVALGSPSTGSGALAAGLAALTKAEFAAAQQTLRVEGLRGRLQRDLDLLREKRRRVEGGGEFRVPPELAGQAAEWTRTTRHLQRKTEDYQERVEALESEYAASRAASGVTVEALIDQEKAVLALKEHVLNLEAQARGFQGLPPEKDLARLEVERVAAELQGLLAKREKLYDGMVGS